MNRLNMMTMMIGMWMAGGMALASEAETSARAGNDRRGNGTASATARYEGDRGFARTRTQSGDVTLARGVAVGVDRDGISLSVSNAVASKRGPAIATNLNISIGRDGQRSVSLGAAVAQGGDRRVASAGGSAVVRRGISPAVASASGETDRRGKVIVRTYAKDHKPERKSRPRRVIIVRR